MTSINYPKSKPAESKVKKYAIISSIAIIIIAILILIGSAYSKAKEVEKLVKAGNYLAAYEKLDRKEMSKFVDEEILDKAEIVGGMEYEYKYANEKKWDKVNNYKCVVLSSIGAHQKLLDWDLYDYTEEMVLDSAQQMDNYRDKILDDTVSEMLYEAYNNSENQRVEPYRTDDSEGATEYIEYIISTIDSTETE